MLPVLARLEEHGAGLEDMPVLLPEVLHSLRGHALPPRAPARRTDESPLVPSLAAGCLGVHAVTNTAWE